MTRSDPKSATYYVVDMLSRMRFYLPQQEGERLCEELAKHTHADDEPDFLRCDDLAGSDVVLNLALVESMWFCSPASREWDKTWSTELKQERVWGQDE